MLFFFLKKNVKIINKCYGEIFYMSETKIYSPIATGSTEPRDIRDRLADFVNVKDFGAKGDGTTDDTAAFQNAISSTSGEHILVPRGNYKISSNISGKFFSLGNVSITGEGSVSIFNVLDCFREGEINARYNWPLEVYVDPTNGNDNNDGKSAETPVKTIAQAKQIYNNKFYSNGALHIHLAGGTYDEEASSASSRTVTYFGPESGTPASITGMSSWGPGTVYIKGLYSLRGMINVCYSGVLFLQSCTLTIPSFSGTKLFYIYGDGHIFIPQSNTVNINLTGSQPNFTSAFMQITNNSSFNCYGEMTFSGTAKGNKYSVYHHGFLKGPYSSFPGATSPTVGDDSFLYS